MRIRQLRLVWSLIVSGLRLLGSKMVVQLGCVAIADAPVVSRLRKGVESVRCITAMSVVWYAAPITSRGSVKKRTEGPRWWQKRCWWGCFARSGAPTWWGWRGWRGKIYRKFRGIVGAQVPWHGKNSLNQGLGVDQLHLGNFTTGVFSC
jgi:hypothetical protein